MVSRRSFLAGSGAAATLAVTSRAFAQWQPSQRYPDPSVQIVDQSFARYRLNLAKVERLATGFRWSEGPVWFGDGRYVLWSDIPNNRIMRWDEETGTASVFRKPSNFANGNSRDRQGRLITCEHGTRRVSCSQLSSRPWRSRVLPLALFEGLRNTLMRPVSSSHFMMRLFGMSLHRR